MKNWHKWALGSALFCAVMSSADAASPTYFVSCDGYGSPTADGDGMTKPATALFGIIGTLGSSGNTRRVTPFLGSSGVEACNQALADARLLDRYWLRRVSLLRARAIHDLSAGQVDAALRDLDQADAAARDPADPYYERSLSLGTKLIRAYALRRAGQADKAREIVAGILKLRPFDRHVAVGSLAILGDEEGVINGQPILWNIARLSPKAVDQIFVNAFDRADFAQVIALHSQLSPPVAVPDLGVPGYQTRLQEMQNTGLTLFYNGERRARLAYALAATGQAEAARNAIRTALSQLAENTPAPVDLPPAGVAEKRKDRERREATAYIVSSGAEARKAIEAWNQLVEFRIALHEGHYPDSPAAIPPLPRNGAAMDLLQTIARGRPQTPGIQDAIVLAKEKIRHDPMDTTTEIKLLFESLPHTEIEKKVASYKKAKSEFMGYLWGGVSGFKILGAPTDSGASVQFVGEQSSASVVEEMALLRAADLAREAGKSGFVIKGRQDYQRTTNTTYYGTVLRSDPNGYSTRLDIEFVDDATAGKYKTAPWRVLKVSEVIDQLGPTYFAASEPAVASR